MVANGNADQKNVPHEWWMWRRYMGDIAPEAWVRELEDDGPDEIKDQIRYVLEERFFGDSRYTAEDLIFVANELTEILPELIGCGNDAG